MKLQKEHLLAEVGQDNPVYIYGFGLAGRWLAGLLSDRIYGFIDTDVKKSELTFDNMRVMCVEEAMEVLTHDSIIVNSVIDLQDVLSIIRRLPHAKSIPLGLFLEQGPIEEAPNLGESIEFIDYSLTAVEQYHKAYFNDSLIFLRSVDVVITERCSLKCKDCSNLMQYYQKPINVEKEEVLADFDTLAEHVDHIFEVRLIGGEPFMNKDIYSVIEHIVDSPKISRLVIYTNAMVPFTSSGLAVMQHPKIVLSITDYGPLARHTKPNVARLLEAGVTHRVHPPENWTDSGVIHDFSRTDQENEQIFENCCGKNLLTLTNGKLYRCPFAANADRLGAIPYDPDNFVAASATNPEIRHYLREIKRLPACNFCKGRSFDASQIEPAVQTRTPLPYDRRQPMAASCKPAL